MCVRRQAELSTSASNTNADAASIQPELLSIRRSLCTLLELLQRVSWVMGESYRSLDVRMNCRGWGG